MQKHATLIFHSPLIFKWQAKSRQPFSLVQLLLFPRFKKTCKQTI